MHKWSWFPRSASESIGSIGTGECTRKGENGAPGRYSASGTTGSADRRWSRPWCQEGDAWGASGAKGRRRAALPRAGEGRISQKSCVAVTYASRIVTARMTNTLGGEPPVPIGAATTVWNSSPGILTSFRHQEVSWIDQRRSANTEVADIACRDAHSLHENDGGDQTARDVDEIPARSAVPHP